MKKKISLFIRFKKYIANSSWIMSEKIVLMGLGFVATAVVARFLGPEDYGNLSYAYSLTAFFVVLICFVLILFYAVFYEKVDSSEFLILCIISLSLFFKPFEVIDYWFKAVLLSKYTTIVRTVSNLISIAVRILFIFLGLQLSIIASTYVLQGLLSTLLFLLFLKTIGKISVLKFKFDWRLAKKLFCQGWIFFL